MARKIAHTILLLALLAAGAAAPVLHQKPDARPILLNPQSNQTLDMATHYASPANVQIDLIPSCRQADSILVTWDATPGARGYRVYTAVAIPDSSELVPYCEPIQDPVTGANIHSYLYSFHPRFGDVCCEKIGDEPLSYRVWGGPAGTSRAKRILFSPWQPDTLGFYSGCTYTRPRDPADRDRFFTVTAIY
jgi:hypothetical protein